MSDGDQPPPYSEAVSSDSETVVETSTNIEINVIQQTIHSDDGLNITNDNATGSRGRRNARNTHCRHTIEGVPNASNSFSGFLDIVHEQKKQPSGFVTNMTYKVGLFIYFFTNFIYSIVAVAVQKQHLAYHLIYILTSLIGLLFKIFVIIVHVKNILLGVMMKEKTKHRVDQIRLHTENSQGMLGQLIHKYNIITIRQKVYLMSMYYYPWGNS